MTNEIVLTLPPQLYNRLQQWTSLTQQDMAQTVADALELALAPLELVEMEAGISLSELTDEEVLTLTHLTMTPQEGARLDTLQKKLAEGALTNTEEQEYARLLQIYHALWLRQSQALAEAVQRGLMPPLSTSTAESRPE